MFFGLDWITALIKISFQVVFAIVTAIPFSMSWNAIAPVYLTFLPPVWLHVPYWHVVGLLLCATYVGGMIQKLTPQFVNISQSNSNDSEAKNN